MKYVLILSAFLLAGCGHNSMRPEWPDAPNVGACPELDIAPNTEKLSELLSVVTANYGRYHECTARVEAWQEWYDKQKKIYQEVK